jgi:hypothetical protein
MVRGIAGSCGLWLAISCGGGSTTSRGDDGGGGAGEAGSGGANGGSSAGAGATSGSAGESGKAGAGGSSNGGSSSGGSGNGGSSTAGLGGMGASGATGGGGAGSANGGTSGSGGAPGGMGGAGGTAPNTNVTYEACPYIGGVNRLNLYKYDSARHLCFHVVVSEGNMQPFPETTAPPRWFVERGLASLVTATCPEQGTMGVAATTMTGSVSWQMGPTSIPEAIDVNLVLEFPMRMELPASESFETTGLDADCN